jgi:translation initiation factor eIF-2B subunit alpha
VLTHGFSRVVLTVLLRGASEGKRFNVIVTEAKPGDMSAVTIKRLREAGVPVVLILDSTVARIMDKVDLVLVGAEAIVENGGILNKVIALQKF